MFKKILITSAVLLTAATHAQAAVYDFTNPGTSSTEIGSGFGNALDFGDMTATAWATTGDPVGANNSLLNNAQIQRFSTGLGVCNRSEGTNCSNPAHQVDNFGDDDYVLFLFDQQMTFDNIVIDPYGTWDRDVTYWIADVTNPIDLAGLDPAALDFPGSTVFGDPTFQYAGPSNQPLTINLLGTGNALLFAAQADAGDKYDDDRFKITSLTATVVPVPAAVWLFGSGLLGLVGIARRKAA